jgi:hypothetical protein
MANHDHVEEESIAVVVAQTRDLEAQGKRYKNLLHQVHYWRASVILFPNI